MRARTPPAADAKDRCGTAEAPAGGDRGPRRRVAAATAAQAHRRVPALGRRTRPCARSPRRSGRVAWRGGDGKKPCRLNLRQTRVGPRRIPRRGPLRRRGIRPRAIIVQGLGRLVLVARRCGGRHRRRARTQNPDTLQQLFRFGRYQNQIKFFVADISSNPPRRNQILAG